MSATLAQLRTRSKRRADRENSSFVSDAEWLDYINEEISALHNLLVLSYEDYSITSHDFSVVSGTASYALPADFYKERGVEFVGSNYSYTLRQYRFRERNRYQDPFNRVYSNQLELVRYQILGANIVFAPEPTSSGTIRMWYVPQATKLVSDSDTTDFSVVNGWEAYVVSGAAAKALQKEQEETTHLMMEQQRIIANIQREAASRTTGDVKRIVNVDVPDFVYAWDI